MLQSVSKIPIGTIVGEQDKVKVVLECTHEQQALLIPDMISLIGV